MAIRSSASAGAYQQMSVTTVVNLTTPPAQCTYALLSPETNGIRWRDDGTDPTASVGFPVAAGSTLVYDGDVSKIRVVSQTGTATLNVAYFVSRHP